MKRKMVLKYHDSGERFRSTKNLVLDAETFAAIAAIGLYVCDIILPGFIVVTLDNEDRLFLCVLARVNGDMSACFLESLLEGVPLKLLNIVSSNYKVIFALVRVEMVHDLLDVSVVLCVACFQSYHSRL
jgi:hypothetical protein